MCDKADFSRSCLHMTGCQQRMVRIRLPSHWNRQVVQVHYSPFSLTHKITAMQPFNRFSAKLSACSRSNGLISDARSSSSLGR